MKNARVHVYDDANTLWQELMHAWIGDPEAILVVANDRQRDNFLRMVLKEKDEEVIVGNRVITVRQLYGRVLANAEESTLPVVPTPLADIIVQHVYQDNDLSFAARRQALDEIDAVLEHSLPATPQQQMAVDEINRHGYRAYQQEAELLLSVLPDVIDIAPRVLLAPAGEIGVELSKLLRRVRNLERWAYNISLLQVLDDEEIIYHQKQEVIKTRPAELIDQVDTNLMATALKRARSLISSGIDPADITIVSWGDISTVIPLATKCNVPIEASLRPEVLSSPLLGLLSAIARSPTDPLYEDIPGIEAYKSATDPVERLVCIYEIGCALLRREDDSYIDYNIVESYLKELAAQILVYAEYANDDRYAFSMPDVAEVVDNIQGEELSYRSADKGVIITNLAGAAYQKSKYLIIPGFSDSLLRRRVYDSPFNTSEANKSLAQTANLTMERFIQNALASADNTIIIHAQKNSDGFDELLSPLIRNCAPLTHSKPQMIYSAPIAITRQLAELQAVNYQVGTQFSVTELEAWLRCPLGWYVQYILKPQSVKPSAAMERGSILHNVLEKAYSDHSLDDTEVLVLAAKANLSQENNSQEYPAFSPTELAVYQQFLERVIRQYSGIHWPFAFSQLEESFSLRGALPNFTNITLTGKVDRIDYDDNGRPLIIDYKHNKGVTVAPRGGDSDLQVGLYPHLLKEVYSSDQIEPLGFLYINLVKGKAVGVAADPKDPLPMATINRKFSNEPLEKTIIRCLEAAERAIHGIHEGDVYRIGDKCVSDWCPHHLLSHTLQGAVDEE